MTCTIDDLLTAARAELARLTPAAAADATAAGARLVDIRPLEQRRRQGDVPGALIVGRTVFEWRLDPSSTHRIPGLGPDDRIVVLCNQGYASSLAAVSLRQLGVDATDVAGGFEAWARAGLSVEPCRGPSSEEAAGFDVV